MPDHPNPEKKSPPSSKDFQVPPIPKQTAGAVTGAAIGSIAGPTGAVVGGVISKIVRSKVRKANGTRAAQIDKVSAKIDIVGCAAETPWRSAKKALKRLSCLLARNIDFHAAL